MSCMWVHPKGGVDLQGSFWHPVVIVGGEHGLSSPREQHPGLPSPQHPPRGDCKRTPNPSSKKPLRRVSAGGIEHEPQGWDSVLLFSHFMESALSVTEAKERSENPGSLMHP